MLCRKLVGEPLPSRGRESKLIEVAHMLPLRLAGMVCCIRLCHGHRVFWVTYIVLRYVGEISLVLVRRDWIR